MRNHRDIAIERMHILYKFALKNAKDSPSVAQRHADSLLRISLKYRVPLPYEMRQSFCKKCKMFITPGVKSRVRVNGARVCITCAYCGHVYRKITVSKAAA